MAERRGIRGLGVRWSWAEIPALRHWVGLSTSLGLSFFICYMGLVLRLSHRPAVKLANGCLQNAWNSTWPKIRLSKE